eukprot:CAMPEP_0172727250 /NCGR_PEP_ID=MMETSP1074-20121228/91569_1 /TAXON_ID=2916 /ORGANISM="Ceratium fusus, Strain PA161109" /LENGTH=135 /DNA_ID=CAMNT_0013554377 /DNA_START=77 /DNA_END=482 /DNA_ORIENTATION=-
MDCALGLVLGLGIGSYSAQHGLRDCLDGTFHLTKKSAMNAKEKAGPHLAKAHEAALPYVKQVSANVSQKISDLAKNDEQVKLVQLALHDCKTCNSSCYGFIRLFSCQHPCGSMMVFSDHFRSITVEKLSKKENIR